MMRFMHRVDITIIGAGVVGLAIAQRISSDSREIVLVERHDGFGREASSRNSEVVHGGLYYSEKFLKTQLCVQGNPMLYELCQKAGIAHRKAGKIIVATTDEEIEKLHEIFKQGVTNGVPGLRLITKAEIEELEPCVFGLMGLYSSESGILDVHQLMRYLEQKAIAQGVILAYNCKVKGLHRESDFYTVEIEDADGGHLELSSSIVINSAGLDSDRIVAMAGIDVDASGYTIHLCKGEYFKVSGRHRGVLKHLIYPTPTPVSLGAHADIALDGSFKVGPSAFYVESVDYDVDALHQQEFYDRSHRFLPFLEFDDLSPDMSGIRPKLYTAGEPIRDFIIREESDKDLPGLVNLIGIESPGLTSCLAIAQKVENIVESL
jgi:L-2-hydroxyglutarate oxidase LhgO